MLREGREAEEEREVEEVLSWIRERMEVQERMEWEEQEQEVEDQQMLGREQGVVGEEQELAEEQELVEEQELEAVIYPVVTFPLTTFLCTGCDKTFTSEGRRNAHFAAMHKDPTKCHVCQKTFTSRKIFKRHLLVHQPPAYECDQCGKFFKRLDSLQRHVGARHQVPALACPSAKCHRCGKKFTKRSSMITHILVVHGRSNPSKSLLLKYGARVRARKIITCATCHITFSSRSNFNKHMRKSHGEAQLCIQGPAGPAGFLMKFDGRAVGDVDDLPCNYCDKSFKTKKDLIKHKAYQHKGERVHPCDQCGKSYKSAAGLHQHRSRVHRGLEFTCTRCGKNFMAKDSLNRHIRVTCGKEKPRKTFEALTKWGKGHRVKKTAEEIMTRLGSMGEEERRRTMLHIAKKKPELIDGLTSNPFTIEDICQVIINQLFLSHLFFHHF